MISNKNHGFLRNRRRRLSFARRLSRNGNETAAKQQQYEMFLIIHFPPVPVTISMDLSKGIENFISLF